MQLTLSKLKLQELEKLPEEKVELIESKKELSEVLKQKELDMK